MRTDRSAGVAIPCEDAPEVTREDRLALFRLVLLHRLIEERVGLLYRQGRISGSVYTGRGQEAVGAAAGYALGPDDVCAPLNRELACHLARGVTTAEAFRNFLGKGDSPTQGRDGNMHFGAPEHGVFPLVSMLGDLCPVIVGAALAFKRRREPRVALTFWGDGAMSTGDVHEGLNLAAVLKVPAVFVLQSNGWAYSTPTSRQMMNTCMADRVEGGWGIPADARGRQRRRRHSGRPARRDRARALRRRARRQSRRSRCGSTGTPRTTTAATWIRRSRASTPSSAIRSSGWPSACASTASRTARSRPCGRPPPARSPPGSRPQKRRRHPTRRRSSTACTRRS